MVRILYFCEVCDKQFSSKTLAEKCERLPINNDNIKIDEFYIKDGTMLYVDSKEYITKVRNAHERHYNTLVFSGADYKSSILVCDDLWMGEDLKKFRIASEKEISKIPLNILDNYLSSHWKKNVKLPKKLNSVLRSRKNLLKK